MLKRRCPASLHTGEAATGDAGRQWEGCSPDSALPGVSRAVTDCFPVALGWPRS